MSRVALWLSIALKAPAGSSANSQVPGPGPGPVIWLLPALPCLDFFLCSVPTTLCCLSPECHSPSHSQAAWLPVPGGSLPFSYSSTSEAEPGVAVKSLAPGVGLGYVSRFCLFSAVQLWTSYSASLCLTFVVCKIGIMIACASQVVVGIKYGDVCALIGICTFPSE